MFSFRTAHENLCDLTRPWQSGARLNIQLVNHTLIEEADFFFSIFNIGPALSQLSAALSEEPGKRNSFYFTGPQEAAEQNSNKISQIM